MAARFVCPDDEKFGQFIASEFLGDEAEQFASHLEQCGKCIARLEKASVDSELANDLGSSMPEVANDTHLVELMSRFERLANSNALEPHLAEEEPGTMIGPYQLRQHLGKGGMGVVWMAEQCEPLRREVAVKIIKASLQSDQVLARFEAERQALAIMDHPNIARVFDAGTTATGRPYFVMELVKGVPFSSYCDQEKLTVKERLELFIPICGAVQHAHQKGIVHRDLKPSNVLVAHYDGKAVPKVIDFGVAKATHQKLTEQTMVTELGQIIGTLEYMAPEQAKLSNLDIDTRADIYSLGVILYELLTGATPVSSKQLRAEDLLENLRIIREVEPLRPSAKLSSSNSAELAAIAERRQLEPKKLTRLVHGDLDWIAMKCLEKDRIRRYETANLLGQELQRFLTDEPVEAGPPSGMYRMKKFLRRHRGPVIAAALVVLALVVGFIGTFIGMETAQTNERKANIAAENEWQAKLVAENAAAAEKLATKKALAAADAEKLAAAKERQANIVVLNQLNQIEKANELLESIFRDINPRMRQKGELLQQLIKRLSEAGDKLDEAAFSDLKTVARLQDILGVTLVNLGASGKAIELHGKAKATHERKLGPGHRDTLRSMNNLAYAYQANGRLDMALRLFEETVAKMKANLGPDDPLTLNTMNNLGVAYQARQHLDKALPLLQDTLAKRKAMLGPDHPDTLTTMMNLAAAHYATGQFPIAVSLFEETLTGMIAKLDPNHYDTLNCMNNLAIAYQANGQLDMALRLFEQSLAKMKAKLGPDDLLTLRTMYNLASGYLVGRQMGKALPLLEETLVMMRSKLESDHKDTLNCMSNLASAYYLARQLDKGHLDKALSLYNETLKKMKIKFGPNDPESLKTMHNLAVTYLAANEPNKAIPFINEFLAIRRKQLAAGDALFAGQLATVTLELLMHKQHAAAEPILLECLAIRSRIQPEDWSTFNTKTMLGGCLLGQKKFSAAEPLVKEGYEGMKQREKTIPPAAKVRLTEALERLVQFYEATGNGAEADRLRKEFAAQKQQQ